MGHLDLGHRERGEERVTEVEIGGLEINAAACTWSDVSIPGQDYYSHSMLSIDSIHKVKVCGTTWLTDFFYGMAPETRY